MSGRSVVRAGQPASGPQIGSLFTGYGGLERGVQEVLGGTVAWHCEFEPPTKQNPKPTQGAARLLAHHFPDVPNLGDITTVDWASVDPVDVLTLGFPCTDVSCAGLRRGLTPTTRSGLWAYAAQAIAALCPSLVFIENVRGLLSATADHPAHSDVEPCPWELGDGSGPALRALGAVLGDLADIGYDASWQGLRAADVGAPHGRFRVFVVAWPAQDAYRAARGERWLAASGQAEGGRSRADAGGRGGAPAADSDSHGLEGIGRLHSVGRDADGRGGADIAWGPFESAVRRWEQLTRPAPAPVEQGRTGARLSPAFVEWMQGLPAGWVTDVPGLTRNEQLKALGNGVVPQQAAQAMRMLLPNVTAPSFSLEREGAA